MRFSLVPLSFVGLLSCSADISLSPSPSPPPTTRSLSSKASLDMQTLTLDVERWTRDTKIDCLERLEILQACGYNISFSRSMQFSVWTRERSRISSDQIYDIPLTSLDVEYFLANYYSRPKNH